MASFRVQKSKGKRANKKRQTSEEWGTGGQENGTNNGKFQGLKKSGNERE